MAMPNCVLGCAAREIEVRLSQDCSAEAEVNNKKGGTYLECASGVQCLAASAPAPGARTGAARPCPSLPSPQRPGAEHSASRPDRQRRARRARRGACPLGRPPRGALTAPAPAPAGSHRSTDTGRVRELTGRESGGGAATRAATVPRRPLGARPGAGQVGGKAPPPRPPLLAASWITHKGQSVGLSGPSSLHRRLDRMIEQCAQVL